MAKVWEEQLGLLVTQQKFERDTLVKRVQATRKSIERLAAELEGLEQSFERSSEQFKARLDKLLNRRDDPEVWVRNYGAGVYAYHSPEKPCGWARDPSSFRRMLLSDARDRGITPCKSCGSNVRAA